MKFRVKKDFKVNGMAYKAGTVVDLPWHNTGIFDQALEVVPESTTVTGTGTPVKGTAAPAAKEPEAPPAPAVPAADQDVPPAPEG